MIKSLRTDSIGARAIHFHILQDASDEDFDSRPGEDVDVLFACFNSCRNIKALTKSLPHEKLMGMHDDGFGCDRLGHKRDIFATRVAVERLEAGFARANFGANAGGETSVSAEEGFGHQVPPIHDSRVAARGILEVGANLGKKKGISKRVILYCTVWGFFSAKI